MLPQAEEYNIVYVIKIRDVCLNFKTNTVLRLCLVSEIGGEVWKKLIVWKKKLEIYMSRKVFDVM